MCSNKNVWFQGYVLYFLFFFFFHFISSTFSSHFLSFMYRFAYLIIDFSKYLMIVFSITYERFARKTERMIT